MKSGKKKKRFEGSNTREKDEMHLSEETNQWEREVHEVVFGT